MSSDVSGNPAKYRQKKNKTARKKEKDVTKRQDQATEDTDGFNY